MSSSLRFASCIGASALALVLYAPACEDRSTPSEGSGGEGGTSLAVPAGCNPLASEGDCLLPYPSDVFRQSEGAGFVVRYPEATWIRFEGEGIDVAARYPQDGFSVGTPILALLPGGVEPSNLVFYTDDVSRSTGPESPTIVLDPETGERIEHFAELDPNTDELARKALILRPLTRLTPGKRYVVALRGLRAPSGELAPAPPRFLDLRDAEGAADPAIASLSARYEAEVFAPLEAAGVARSELQLAWDFTTRTDQSAIGDMLAMREDLLAKLEVSAPEVSIESVAENPTSHTARKIEAVMRVPLYVDSAEPGAALNREGGKVAAKGEVEVPFTIWVPKSVAERGPEDEPARLLQYGHGFFGERYEVDGSAAQLANERGFVVVATDWWGMSASDRGVLVGDLVVDPANTMRFSDRVHQGMANQLALAEVAARVLPTLPELEVQGESAYDPSEVYFYGISMGHILGGTYLALSPRVSRGVLEVGGANFSMMMFRAQPFAAFLALLMLNDVEALDQQKFAALAQHGFDRLDPFSYAPYVLRERLPGAPTERRVLMRVGIGDASVPNLGTYMHARALGVPLLSVPGEESSPTPIGLERVSSPHDGSGISIYDFGIEASTVATPPTEGNVVHDGLRRLEAAKEQLDRFLRPGGLVEHTCEGPCDPE